jgi:predicted GNAT family N-acyltransferase
MTDAADSPADVRVVRDDDAYEDAVAVRMAVFVDEQGVPEQLELDDHEDEAVHFVAYEPSDHDHDGPGHHHDEPGDPIGAARLREPDDGVGKVERVAVLDSHRGRGVGRELMVTAESVAAARGYDRLVLHAQTTATGFYERLGYERVGDTFQEDGIEHVEMRKQP